MKVEPEPEPEDMISSVKSRRLMAMQAKKEKEEMDRQNKGKLVAESGADDSCVNVLWLTDELNCTCILILFFRAKPDS